MRSSVALWPTTHPSAVIVAKPVDRVLIETREQASRVRAPIHFLLCLLVLLELSGCTSNARAPITQKSAARPETVTIHSQSVGPGRQRASAPTNYVVQRGDTLYSIAWKFGLDFRNVSKWNSVANPNLIYVGQKLRLVAPNRTSVLKRAKPTRTKPTIAKPKRARVQVAKANSKPPAVTKKKISPKTVTWSWPASGKVQPASSALGTKGIEILGTAGQPVRAAGHGSVVYSGSGLRGYGQLIIVKHSEQFLSAYAHNARLIVGEGEAVKQGQKIAEMGDTDAKRVMLHFEIRRDGKAVEPLKYLPHR